MERNRRFYGRFHGVIAPDLRGVGVQWFTL